VPLDMMTLCL